MPHFLIPGLLVLTVAVTSAAAADGTILRR